MKRFARLVPLILASAASGQTLGPEVLVSNDDPDVSVRDSETAIVVNPLNPLELMVAWIRVDASANHIHDATSPDGGFNFTRAAPVPHPTCATQNSDDPFVAASYADGTFFVGGRLSDNREMFVARRTATGLDPTLVSSSCTSSSTQDKPWIALGPSPVGSGETSTASGAALT